MTCGLDADGRCKFWAVRDVFFNGFLMVISWDFIEFYCDFIGFHRILWGFNGGFMGI